ncbi:VanZ family protein [Butyrivibrio sp. LC3010]|uniref:VanZ family protein n=1 Tax=Butyrivibrio sp. LC3010 TaxID=1280680 RepID=UPI0003FCA206|nr:VanZ family protein [Butyrivibrio sp. LC3010]
MFEEMIRRMSWLFVEQISGIYISDFLIIFFACALIILVPGYVLYIKKMITYRKIILIYFTVVFACIMLVFTIFRREPGSRSGRILTHLYLGVSRRAIYSPNQVVYCFFNVLLFIPWGVLLSLYRKNEQFLRVVIMTTITGFLFSFLIEIIQHLSRTGVFEVTDLLMNSFGTFIGAIIGYIFVVILKKRENRNGSK